MKIVFLDAKTVGEVPAAEMLEHFGEVICYQTTTYEQTYQRIKDADVIITNKAIVDKAIIGQAERLQLICVAATGTNNVDKTAAKQRGIAVKNVVNYSSASVAQLTFSMLLHLINRVEYFDRYVKEGGYEKSDTFTHLEKTFWEISGKRFGVIGLGNIGRKVAEIAAAFGAEVVYYSTSGKNDNALYKRLELEEFLSTCDIISIHAPLNDHTAKLINYQRLQQMKRTAILMNAGRGGIIDEADLARAIDEGLIAGAGIDVYEKEPIDPTNPLLQVKHKERLVLTPHIAWSSIEARTLLMERVKQNIQKFINERE